MVDFRGQTIPLRVSGAASEADQRPSMEELYPRGVAQYREKVLAEIERQVGDMFGKGTRFLVAIEYYPDDQYYPAGHEEIEP